MKVGDLVFYADGLSDQYTPERGLILRIIDDVEVPSAVEILWNNGYISKVYADEVEVDE